MKQNLFLQVLYLLLFSPVLVADTPLIRTTNTDSYRDAFTAQTPLLRESAEYGTLVLPDNVNSYGGFAIGDIDRDGNVEIVFGTSDGYLHCWELGSCSTGYAPWPQFKHDNRRSGVLE